MESKVFQQLNIFVDTACTHWMESQTKSTSFVSLSSKRHHGSQSHWASISDVCVSPFISCYLKMGFFCFFVFNFIKQNDTKFSVHCTVHSSFGRRIVRQPLQPCRSWAFSKYESFTLQSMLLSGPGLKTPEFPFNKVGTKTLSLYLSIINSKNFLLHFLHFNTNKPVLKM